MKLTKTGYRISKNGSVIDSIENEAIAKQSFEGDLIKDNGLYYFFNRKQGDLFIYLP